MTQHLGSQTLQHGPLFQPVSMSTVRGGEGCFQLELVALSRSILQESTVLPGTLMSEGHCRGWVLEKAFRAVCRLFSALRKERVLGRGLSLPSGLWEKSCDTHSPVSFLLSGLIQRRSLSGALINEQLECSFHAQERKIN